jgi:ribonuclease BN (tRNA processing enzyme)
MRTAVVKHVEPTLVSLAYRFNTRKGSIVFAGDCTDCAALRELVAGADTLVVACTHFGAPAVSESIADAIAGVQEVAAVANAARVRRVVLTHMSPGFENPETRQRAVDAVAANCQSEVLCPDELSTIEV